MEDSQDMKLLQSLRNAGVSIPDDVASLRDLTPETFVPICIRSLNLVDGDDETSSFSQFPSSLPDSMIDKIKICTDVALAFKRIGFIGDLSYYQFLYPSEEDLYKLAWFLVERLSKSSNHVIDDILRDTSVRKKLQEDGPTNNLDNGKQKNDNEELDLRYYKEKLRDLGLDNVDPDLFTSDVEDTSIGPSSKVDIGKDELNELDENPFAKEEQESMKDALENEESILQTDDMHVQEVTSSKEQYSNQEVEKQEKVLMGEIASKSSEIKHLEEDYELLKTMAEMAFDDQHTIDFYMKQLNEQIDARKCTLTEIELQRDASREPLEEKIRGLEEFVYAKVPDDGEEKLQKLREAELEMQLVLSEVRRREEELSELSAELKWQPRIPSRLTHIERIREISKNSRKQDADIARIIKETRELQLESNSIQERLQRIYTVLDEIVYRETKKDPVGRQAYRLLTSIHEIFEQISEQLLNTDRIHREVAEHEKKLRAMGRRTLNADKLQADLDALRKENEQLQQQIQQN